MINRDLIRRKIVQLTYAYYQNSDHNMENAEKELMFSLSKSYDLYNYMLQLIVAITQEARKRYDVDVARAKREGEQEPSPRFAFNKFALQLEENKMLLEWIDVKHSNWDEDIEMVRKVYTAITSSDLYADYVSGAIDEELADLDEYSRDREVWRRIYKQFIQNNEELDAFLEEKSLYLLDGYIEVGMVRALNTLLMIFAMAFGIAFAIQVCHIDNFVKDLTMTPHHEYWEFAIAAAVSAMGFSTIFSIPRRLLPAVAVGGIIAVCFRNFVNLGPSNGNIGLDMGLSIGSLAGSALISVIVIKARHWFHTPHQCITIPSVIPMVPGVLMYRALFAFIDMHGVVGEVTVGMNNLIKASLAIICIALGVAIPNVFFRRFIADNRKRRLLNMLVERKKKNGEFVDLHEVEIK